MKIISADHISHTSPGKQTVLIYLVIKSRIIQDICDPNL
jgi:hypothetical protein